jgi:hypothetical protein
MKSHLSDPWTHATAYIEMLYADQVMGSGSGFFWSHAGRTLLCTNWHNLAGRNPITDEPLSTYEPEAVRVFGFKRASEPDSDGFYEMKYTSFEVALRGDVSSERFWREHATFGRSVDVAVIDVTDNIAEFDVRHVNELEHDAVLSPFTSQDVFALGFPFGQIAGAPAPVWKRGTIAIDPTYDTEGLPKLLIDTATRRGMSGSVVLARHIILGSDFEKKDGSRGETVLFARMTLVLGVYSGRHYPDLEKAQLGIVWKRRALEEVISQGVHPTTVKLDD